MVGACPALRLLYSWELNVHNAYFWFVGFIFPLFLIAGITLLIPVLIHLFNLRRYKTVYFPHTRFLKNIQLQSQKQSQLRYKWLLAARLLFLAMLVFAFAQPFLHNAATPASGKGLQVVYIDNSYSMSVKKGARTLLDIAKESAAGMIGKSGGSFIVMTNDRVLNYMPLTGPKAISTINGIDFSPVAKNNMQAIALLKSVLDQHNNVPAAFYYFSDFQQNAFLLPSGLSFTSPVHFTGVAVQGTENSNVYIDTAWLATPVLQTNSTNKLIVKSRFSGKPADRQYVIQMSVNGQIKSAATLRFDAEQTSIDTLSFQVSSNDWNNIAVFTGDQAVHFDDTFLIAARSTPQLSVLVVNQGAPNPYIQAAFRSFAGFKMTERDVANLPAAFSDYNLVVLNNINHITQEMAGKIKEGMQAGRNVCIFPAAGNNPDQLNQGLEQLGDIHIAGWDTARQSVSSLQQGNSLVKDIFDHIPENVQLPMTQSHYKITSGLSANGQNIMSFRNGDPFLAAYAIEKGTLFLSAVSAEMPNSNFAGSYFFVPFLYQMAAQSGTGDIYALTAGQKTPVFIRNGKTGERSMARISGQGLDIIPPQRNDGTGLNIFAGDVLTKAGFYSVTIPGTGDSIRLALNSDRLESDLRVWPIGTLAQKWPQKDAVWLNAAESHISDAATEASAFPLWKVCTILALLMLAAETYLLTKNVLKKPVATT